VDVVKPTAGTWTAVIDTTPTSISDSYAGTVEFTWAAERYVALGSVTPSQLTLPPGESAVVTAQFTSPSEPGDLAAAIRFHDTVAGVATSEIPVTVRTLIPTGQRGGSFTTTLTGGNGRDGADPTQTFEFDVPNGVDDMSLSIQVPDAGYSLVGYLVDPNGMALASASNVDADGAPQPSVQLFRASPQQGAWRFVLQQLSAGGETSVQVTGQLGFNTAKVTAAGLPTATRTRLSASAAPLSVPVVVTNTGTVTKAYFADARLSTYASVSLPTNVCSSAPTTPGLCAYAYVPTQATNVQFVATAAVPLDMDAAWSIGDDPDLFAYATGNGSVTASTVVPEVPFSAWVLFPALVGPYGASGAAATAVTTSATATIHPFDTAVSASSGDVWADLTLGTNTFNPLILAPGATGTITLTITPGASEVGTQVTGSIFVDTFNGYDEYASGDEVVAIPYAYTVSK
jgi:hypothetical protein